MRGEQNNILFPVRIWWGNIFPHLAVWSVPLGLCGIQPHCAQTKARPYGANLKKQPANNNSCTGTKQQR